MTLNQSWGMHEARPSEAMMVAAAIRQMESEEHGS
jgi:hypothetical protein